MAWFSDYSKRIKLTIDNTNVDATLSDFPVLVKLSDSSGITSADVTSVFTELGSDANRKKIAITTSDGETQCYVEIERFDYSNSVAELWTKVPTVVSGTTTDLYFYYDSDQPENTIYVGDTTDTPAQSVWDSNFKLVMHMAQDPNGDVADAIKDSTSNANHGTPGGSMTTADLVDGKVGKAIDFDGSNDWIDPPIQMVLGSPSIEATVEFVAKGEGNVVTTDRSTNTTGDASIDINSSGAVRYTIDYSMSSPYSRTITSTAISTITEFNYYAVTMNITSNHYLLAVNSVIEGIDEAFVAGAYLFDDVMIARQHNYTYGTFYYSGDLDEIRISNTPRSSAWLKATYYSNWDGLVSFGSEEEEAEVTHYISGYVKEGVIPINRKIYLHNRSTGVLIGSTTSSGAGGYFYCETTYSGSHYVVCLDDIGGLDYNDLIYGNILPTTSG